MVLYLCFFSLIAIHCSAQTNNAKHKYFPLVQDRAFINGEWVEANNGFTFSVFNPCNSSEVANVPDMAEADTKLAISAAANSFPSWSSIPPKERAKLMTKWYTILEENSAQIAQIISLESGKPLKEAVTETSYGSSFVLMYAEEATRLRGEALASDDKSKQYVYLKQPVGVVALITPWNFPFALILRKAAAALAVGCCCIVKPAEDTPLSALAIAATLQQAGFPKGVFNVITASRVNTPSVGKVICHSSQVAALSFTGSTEVGKQLYKQSAPTIKRVSLELGGNAPFIVFPSADLDHSVNCALTAKFRNCGQACVSPNRFLIHVSHFEKFVDSLAWKMKYDLTMGSNFDPLTDVGPLINNRQLIKVSHLVEEAVQQGAKVVTGGGPAKNVGRLFYQPTLLTNVHTDMDVFSEEIFGPVVICLPFTSEDEALAMAHNTSSGLAAYFFTAELQQAWKVAKALQVGMVAVNEASLSSPQVAFGGIKASGFGREGSYHYGIEEFTYTKTICFANC